MMHIDTTNEEETSEDSGHGNPPPKDPPKNGTSGFESEQKAPEA